MDGAVDPRSYFAPLSGQQWLMPCTAAPDPNLCDADDFEKTVTMAGPDSTVYDVVVRIRGVMERGTYANGDGSNGNGWYVGGETTSTTLTAASVTVSAPEATCFLNSVMVMGGGLATLDYLVTMRIAANASVTLTMSALDGRARADSTSAVIMGVTTDPSPYLGQFAQIDVIGASISAGQ